MLQRVVLLRYQLGSVNRSDQVMAFALDRSHSSRRLPPAPAVNDDDSQCETIYDEEDDEMTEEDDAEDDEGDVDEEDEEDDGQTITEGSSTCSQESFHDANEEEASPSNLSQKIQHFAFQFPGLSEQFQILSKIGEGNPPYRLAVHL